MKDKIIKQTIQILIICLVFGTGVVLGSGLLKKEVVEVAQVAQTEIMESKKPETTKEVNSKTIAIVNLDDGVLQEGTRVNYGSTLSEYIETEKVITGLEDARQGLERGVYGAYITIPNTFSEKVSTLNSKPEKATLTYAVAKDLGGEAREEVLAEITDIYVSFNDDLSKIYTSSILKEYHAAQDEASSIMERDKKDAETLSALESHDLISFIEMPQMETVTEMPPSVELYGNYEVGSSSLTRIGDAYQSYLENGQNDFGTIQENAEDLKDNVAKNTENYLKEVSTAVNEVIASFPDNTELGEEEDRVYKDQKTALIGDVTAGDDADGSLTVYNQQLATFNTSITDFMTRNDIVQEQYGSLLEEMAPLHTGLMGMALETYTDSEGNLQSIVFREEKYSAYSTYQVDEAFQRIKEQIMTEYGVAEEDVDALIAGCTSDLEPLILTARTAQVEEPQIEIDGIVYNRMPGININEENGVKDALQMIIDKASAGRDEREQQLLSIKANYDEQHGGIISEVENLSTAYSDHKEKENELVNQVNSYRLSKFIDQDQVNGIMRDFSTNNQEIQSKITEYMSESGTYIGKIYETENQNVTFLQQSIRDGQTVAQEKLKEGLETAQTSRKKSSEENAAVLETFQARLPYTRIGELENKEVYDFIANPLLIDNKSEAVSASQSKVADITDNEQAAVNVKDLKQESQSVPKELFFGIGAVLLVLALAIILSKYGRKRFEEF
jgi:hypothetical protein